MGVGLGESLGPNIQHTVTIELLRLPRGDGSSLRERNGLAVLHLRVSAVARIADVHGVGGNASSSPGVVSDGDRATGPSPIRGGSMSHDQSTFCWASNLTTSAQ